MIDNFKIIDECPIRSKMLLVAQPDAIGLPYLGNTTKEAEEVQINAPQDSQLIDCFTVPVHLALSSVRSASVLHLACHGCQDHDNPLNSGFELQDGRLTLGDLMRVDTPHAQLAYLSACQSAGMDASRPDESLNLAGAMLFVGFKSIIATMW
jgi:CHAT domain-containing protein